MCEPMSGHSPSEDSTVKRAIGFPCHSCGSQMAYSPERGKLFCRYCESEGEIPSPKREAPEYLYFPDKDAYEAPRWEEEERRTLTCPSCGADTVIDAAAVTATCPFCSSHYVTEPRKEDNLILPETIMPFRIGEQEALSRFGRWVKGRLFAPRAFRRGKHRPEPRGIYIPFWTFDASLVTEYHGFGGRKRVKHYTVRVNGKTQTRTRVETDWYPISGTEQLSFDDMPCPATNQIDHRMLAKLGPYSMKVLHVYHPAYLAGFFAERYSIGLREGFASVRQTMEDRMCRHICASRGYDCYRGMQYRHHFHTVHFKHILLPLWLFAYRYGGRVYRCMVNGETGSIAGRAPLSPWKIAGVVLGGLGAVALLVLGCMLL